MKLCKLCGQPLGTDDPDRYFHEDCINKAKSMRAGSESSTSSPIISVEPTITIDDDELHIEYKITKHF